MDMKKFIVALTTLGLISAMSVATFADNFANFNDAQPMQNFTSDINKLYTSNLNKVSSNVVNDLDIKDGYFSCYNGYVYYLDNSKSGYTDLRRMKADKTGDILIHRIVTGESYTLSSYILGDSNLYYTIYNIKTQQHSFRKVDLVTKKDSLIYSSDTAMLEVLASQNGYAYVCETSFDENNDIHRLIYKVNVNKGTDKYVVVTTKTNVNYLCARITGDTLYIKKVDFSNADVEDYPESVLLIDLKKSKIVKEINLGTHNVVDIKNGKAIAQDGGKITSIDLTSGEEKQLLNLDTNKVQMQYLGFYNGKLYYVTYNLSTYENKVSYKNIGTGEMKDLTSWVEQRVE
jgi:hypothetical protein